MSKTRIIPLKSDDYAKSPAYAGLSACDDTIASLASGSGLAAVSIIRISGPKSFAIMGQLVRMNEIREREMYLAKLVDPANGEVVDELMLCGFAGPRSFTGEDSLELYCHGGPYIVNRILALLFQQGARAAQPGEYTKRAFLNGKLDLTAAEGVRELVEASSRQEWMAARQLATGRLGEHIKNLRQSIIGAMAYLEARIDFPDEGDTQSVGLSDVEAMVKVVSEDLARLEASYGSGRVASSGLMVAIVGAPNMGKSSLMNMLLDKNRAIVTDIAGTTRDYIEERCHVNGRLIRLLDTAGIRDTDEVVEKIGVESAIRLAQDADLVIILRAANASSEDLRYFTKATELLTPDKQLQVVNKVDLLASVSLPEGAIGVSCTTGEGLSQLRDAIASRVDDYVGALKDEPFITSARHKEAVAQAQQFLAAFFAGIRDGLYEEMLAFELQNTIRALSSVIGEVEHDDLLDKIFSEFCVGK